MKRSRSSEVSSYHKLPKGVVHMPLFIDMKEQRELLLKMLELGCCSVGGLFHCNNEKTKHMKMMNLGKRTEGGDHDLPIPNEWKQLALRACRAAQDFEPSLLTLDPNVCVVNLYTERSRYEN
jgi:hypothetical protein